MQMLDESDQHGELDSFAGAYNLKVVFGIIDAEVALLAIT
jgi:hypothetical protein